MKFWVDAQLPPLMAEWLVSDFGLDASTLHAIGLRNAPDTVIFQALRQPETVIVSKDEDFVDLITRLSAPPQLLWVTCGNVTNRALRALMARAMPDALRLLSDGEPIVELAQRTSTEGIERVD